MIMNLLTCFSHIYPGLPSYFVPWHFMLLYFPYCSISPHFSVSKLFGSPLFQRHVPADVPLTQAMLSFNQLHVRDPLTVFKPINQRPFLRFLVKFLTKCHSFSVSIETSELFSWWLHLSLAVLQSIVSSSKEYLEQTITKVYGEPTDKREKRQTRNNDQFIYLLIVNINQELKATHKENWIKPLDTRKFLHQPWCSWDWMNETVNFQD